MTRHRSALLRVHLSRSQCHWSLVIRTQEGRTQHDRRLDAGMLPYPTDGDMPHDVLALLQRALWDLMRKHDPSALPRSGPGALEGVGGRPTLSSVGRVSGYVPHAGDPLDEPLPGL